MRRRKYHAVSSLAFQSPSTFLGTLFFFVLGISAGVFTELMMGTAEKEALLSFLNQQLFTADWSTSDFPSVFANSVSNNLGLLLVILLSGLTAVGFPVALAAIAYKGMALGFSSALLIENLAGKGFLLVFTSLIPQSLLLVPALLVGCAAALNLAFYTIRCRRTGVKKSLAENAGSYLTLTIILAAVILCGCVIETVLGPFASQLAG